MTIIEKVTKLLKNEKQLSLQEIYAKYLDGIHNRCLQALA